MPLNSGRSATLGGLGSLSTDLIAVSLGSVIVHAWPFDNGFGTKYSNPATLPAGIGNGVTFTPNPPTVMVANNTTPFLRAYPWSSAGFGTAYANPAALPPNNGRDASFTSDGSAVAIAHISSHTVTAYPWSASGFGTKYTDPFNENSGEGVAFSPNGSFIAVGNTGNRHVNVYPWLPGFGTLFANPAILPASFGNKLSFSPDNANLAVAHSSFPYITAYPWSGSGFGAKYANPAGVGSLDNGRSARFSPNNNVVALSQENIGGLTAWQWSSGFGTQWATIVGGGGSGRDNSFNFKGDLIASGTAFPVGRVAVWAITPTAFGTKFADPAVNTGGENTEGVFFASF